MGESGVAFLVADGLGEELEAGYASFAVDLSDMMGWGGGGKVREVVDGPELG